MPILKTIKSIGLVGLYGRVRDEFFPARDAFDKEHGCDTGGIVHPRRLRVNGKRYQAADPKIFQEAMAHIPGDKSHFAFVDLGCGKGRALILASQYGFENIVGVEQSPKLAAVASRNLKLLDVDAEIVTGDASKFAFPSGPLVCFMYNPFGPAVIRTVCEKLQRRVGPLYVVYVNPMHSEALQNSLALEKVGNGFQYEVWRKVNL